jgi:putative redox protein
MDINKQFIESANAQIGIIPYKTVITSAGHTLLADEPESAGGGDTAMNPNSLLLASLGSCTAMTLRMYIARKMWIVEDVSVKLELFRVDDGVLIERRLKFKGELSDEQKKRLIQIANACPIHKILTGNINIETSLE